MYFRLGAKNEFYYSLGKIHNSIQSTWAEFGMIAVEELIEHGMFFF